MSRARAAALAGVLAAAACGGQPDVAVTAWVGPRYAKDDEERRDAEAAKVWQTALRELFGGAEADATADATPVVQIAAHPPKTAAELAGLVEALRNVPLTEIDGPAHRIAAAEAHLWPELRALLLAARSAPKGDYRSTLAAIGGDVPNRYGHFALAWKKAHGHRVTRSEDWFSDLLLLPKSRVASMLRPVYRDCVLQTAVLQAASRIGAEPAWAADVVDALLHAAYHHEGTFRDEVGRAIRRIGDEAIPHLIRQAAEPTEDRDDEDPAEQRSRYAEVQLDRMDRLHPQRAIESVSRDPRLLTEVLTAYGDAKVGEAAALLLDHADAPDPHVRTAARESIFAYVVGPKPVARRRQVRLLGGGTGTKRAYLTYRQRAAIAILERLALAHTDLIEPTCEAPERGEDTRTVGEKAACDQQPMRHVLAYFSRLDAERAERRAARIDGALSKPTAAARVQALDELLAIEPELPEREQLVVEYRDAAAAALDERNTTKAAQLLRKSAMLADELDPVAARNLRVTALVAEASTPGLSEQGKAMLLGTAASLAPDDAAVVGAYREARPPGFSTEGVPWRRVGATFGGGMLGLLILCGAMSPVRRRVFGRS